MAILSIDELMEEGTRSARWAVSSGRSYTRKFRAITNSRADGPVVILNSFGSKFGDRYNPPYNSLETDPNCYLTDLAIDAEGDDGLAWLISCTYSWYDSQFAGGGDKQNPLAMPIEVSWGLRDHELVLERDTDGKAVLNTAGDPFDPPIMIDEPRMEMTVVRNEPTTTLAWFLTYRNAINSDQFAGFDPFYSKVMNIQAKSQWHQDIGWYSQTTYVFEFLSPKVDDGGKGYRKSILNQGMRSIGTGGKIQHILLRGVPVNTPMLLDQNGKLNALNADPYFLEIKAYPELPFSAFNFDPLAVSGQRAGFTR
jgi:hypothetical protein